MARTKIRSEVFNRPTKAGKSRFYVRFFSDNGILLTTRSLGESIKSRPAANREVDHLLVELRPELEKLYKAKTDGLDEEEKAIETLKATSFGQYVVDFWTTGKSDYLTAEADSGKALSKVYVANRLRYAERFILPYPGFVKPLSEISLLLVERFIKQLKADGLDGNTIDPITKTLQRPISWAVERNLLEEPFVFKGVRGIPRPEYRERSLLSPAQVLALLDLPTVPLKIVETARGPKAYLQKRPRLPGGKKQEGPGPLDLRMKVAVLLSFLTGMRRGEIRALRWKNVDFEACRIHVVENYVRLDGFKEPKRKSSRIVGIPEPLIPILKELNAHSTVVGFDGPEDLVIFNTTPGVPIATVTLRRGFERALEALGIDDETRKAINLVFHSGRHFVAHTLDGTHGARIAASITGHKSKAAFDGYADHQTDESIEQTRKTLGLGKDTTKP